MKLVTYFQCAFFAAAVMGLSGCATVTGSSPNQSISVQTFAADGSDVEGVRCDMTNDEGTWFVMTPGSVTVHRSNKDLQVICKKNGLDVGTATVVSRTKGNMFGNIILGGGIGAIVDHNKGTAYEYPGLLKIYMGRANQRFVAAVPEQAGADKSTQAQQSTSGQAQSGTQAPAVSAQPAAASTSNDALVAAKQKCQDIGFVPATEQFGNCVLKFLGK